MEGYNALVSTQATPQHSLLHDDAALISVVRGDEAHLALAVCVNEASGEWQRRSGELAGESLAFDGGGPGDFNQTAQQGWH